MGLAELDILYLLVQTPWQFWALQAVMNPELDLGHLQQTQQHQWTLPMLNFSPGPQCNQN